MHFGKVHDCDDRCKLLHSSLLPKLSSIIHSSRTTEKSLKLDSGFHLESMGPPPSECPSTLLIILEAPSEMLIESPTTGKMVKIPRKVRSVLLESWSLELEEGNEEFTLLSEFNRDAMLLLRSVYSLTRFLPASRLTKLSPQTKLPSGLSLKVISNAEQLESNCLSLEESILSEGTFETTSKISLPTLHSPHGKFKISVTYRKNCKFDLLSTTEPVSPKLSSFENVDLSPVSGKTLTTEESIPRTGTSIGSSSSRASLKAAMTRSKSNLKLTSPLGTVQEDSDLAAFISACENAPVLEARSISLPPISNIQERTERAKEWLKEEMRLAESKSRLVFSPVLEEAPDENTIFDMSHLE